LKNFYLAALLALSASACSIPPIYRHAEKGDAAALRSLLDGGTDPNASTWLYNHLSPLHVAVGGSHLQAARLLIERGADVNKLAVINRARQARPLHYAACTGNVSIVRLLLESGADPEPGGGECADPNWTMLDPIIMRSPLELAEQRKHSMAAELLRQAIAAKAGLLAQGENLLKISSYPSLVDALLKDAQSAGKVAAVTGFAYADGRASGDGTVISERLTTELVKRPGLRVVERKTLEKIFAELKLQQSGAIGPDTAKKLGQLLGADWVLVGTLSELPGGLLELNARLVDAESGRIISAVAGQVEKNWLTR
jgi:TolB-like protein